MVSGTMQQVFVHTVVASPVHASWPSLRSLCTQSLNGVRVVVVNNAPHDVEWPTWLANEPTIMVVRNFRDQGFARGQNQALESLWARLSESVWHDTIVAILSARVVLSPEALERCVEAFRRDAALMVVAPKVRRAQNQAWDESEEPVLVDTGLIEQAGIYLSRGLECDSRGRGERDEGQYDGESEVFLPGTLCLVVRASALARVRMASGWLDSCLEEHWAMMDLAWRFRAAGLKARFLPNALAWVTQPVPRRSVLARMRWWYRVLARR